MQVKVKPQHYTPEEYLELEKKADYRSEYRDGRILPMAGGTTNHNRLTLDFCTFLNLALRQQNAEIFSGDVRLWITDFRQYTYPDAMVVKGKPIYEGKGKTTIVNPAVIVEVLSSSTRNYDQGDKFDYYRSIPEFEEYILIDQYRFYIKQFVKNRAGKWVLTEYTGEDSVLVLESVEFQVELRELYARVDFELQEE
ncbi:MAG: Uma2 family endonuclease [Cyanobacteria bacterium P01_E01_bin.42]